MSDSGDPVVLTLCKELCEVDNQITELNLKRQAIMEKINKVCTLKTTIQLGNEFGEVIKKGKVVDMFSAVHWASDVLLPWIQRLSRSMVYFQKTLAVPFPDNELCNFTTAQNLEFFTRLEEALAMDLDPITVEYHRACSE